MHPDMMPPNTRIIYAGRVFVLLAQIREYSRVTGFYEHCQEIRPVDGAARTRTVLALDPAYCGPA